MAYLTVKDCSQRLNISIRAIQIRCSKAGLSKGAKGYEIPEALFRSWLLYNKADRKESERIDENETNSENDIITQEFTKEEYKKLERIIIEHGIQKERAIEYKEENQYLKDNLNLANKRIDLVLSELNNSLKLVSEANHLQFIDKTKPNKA